jgi:apolipoprotein N-acyltransferase
MTYYWRYLSKLRCFFYGLLLPLSFAPFHLPGFAIISLALFYHELNKPRATLRLSHIFCHGLAYGLGFFGFGATWIYVSIHDYGHLNLAISAFICLSTRRLPSLASIH